jgi:hypothetical protein
VTLTDFAAPDGDVLFRVGQIVEVRSAEEIIATLDESGELGSLPFMPEMLQYCGQRLTVGKIANKLCDTMTRSGIRRMDNAVHLAGVRCDGGAHGGCQAACLIYWKTAWLRPVDASTPTAATPQAVRADAASTPMALRLIDVSRRPADEDGAERYRCQATELLRAAPHGLPFRALGQYVEDVRSGNVSVTGVIRTFLVGLFDRYQHQSRKVLPKWLWIRGGRPWGFLKGSEGKTPTGRADLQPGELVRIKSKAEIEKTLNLDLLNRGMGFDAEMSRFCGRTARVSRRVDHIVDEHTGRMIYMKSPCIVLEGIVCEGAFNANCPRGIPAYWREIWLERVEEPTG